MEKVKQIIIILLIIIFTCSLVPKEFDNDTFWTIALGEKILEHGVKNEEELVFHENLKFTNPRWLFDVTIASIYNNFGFWGIYTFVLILASLQALLYNRILNKVIPNKEVSFIITLIIMYFSSGEFCARGQIVSFFLYLLEYYCLEQILTSNKKIYSVILVIIPILLANMHASVYPIYFLFYIPYIAEFICSKIKLKNEVDNKIIIENTKILQFIILLIFGILAGFCTIPGLNAHTYMLKTLDRSIGNGISEMKSLGFFDEIGFSSLIIIAIAIIGFTNTKIRLRDSLFILGFALLTHSAVRSVYFFYLISSIGIMRLIRDFFISYNIKFKFEHKKICVVLKILICIVICIISIKNLTFELTGEFTNANYALIEITDYIIENLDTNNIKIYNSFNFGGYLEFRGIKTFIDSRAELFTEKFNEECEVLSDWRALISGRKSYKDIFEKYDITHAILNKGETAYRYIIYDSDWKLIYDYGEFSLYEKVNN